MKIWMVICLFIFSGPGISAQNSLRIMSYNIRHGADEKDQVDVRRIADVIDRVAPDLVALQEVDSATLRSGGADQLRELADRVLMHPVFASAIPFQQGKYGVGVLAKERPLKYRALPLPGKEEQRVLLIVEFPRYVFCCTHFSLTREDQLASVQLITEEIKDTGKPVFLAGDLNAQPDSPVISGLKEKFVILTNPQAKTYPSAAPRECLDYILGDVGGGEAYAVADRRVVDASGVSDHLPVVAEVRLKTEPGQIFRTCPYLQNPVDDGITVSWLTNAPVYSWVEYGTDTVNLKKAHTVVDGQVICNNYIHKIRLNDLLPGKDYYYRICSKEILVYRAYRKVFGDTVKSDFCRFKMPGNETTDFVALVFNDIHKQHRTMEALYEQVKDQPYDFVIFNGDCIDDPENEEQAVYSLKFFNEKVGASRLPVFYLRGNHEIRNAYSIQLRELFDYVGNKTYGAFNWGDTRFVMLDCGEDKPDTHWVYYGLNDFTRLREDQAGFLKQELNGQAFRKATKRVLLHHVPLYGNTDEYQPCRVLWGKLLEKAPFDVALNAHTHEYAFHPKGALGNNFPVFIGGGYSRNDATVMVLTKRGDILSIKVLDTNGKILKEMQL